MLLFDYISVATPALEHRFSELLAFIFFADGARDPPRARCSASRNVGYVIPPQTGNRTQPHPPPEPNLNLDCSTFNYTSLQRHLTLTHTALPLNLQHVGELTLFSFHKPRLRGSFVPELPKPPISIEDPRGRPATTCLHSRSRTASRPPRTWSVPTAAARRSRSSVAVMRRYVASGMGSLTLPFRGISSRSPLV